METAMSDALATALPATETGSASSFVAVLISNGMFHANERAQRVAIELRIRAARANPGPPHQPIHMLFQESASEPTAAQQVFDAIQDLYLSHTTPRDRQIAERLIALHRDAIAENEGILGKSVRQFADFFIAHPALGLPKITLTPDGTLRARWIQGPASFVAIEFTGEPLAKLVAEVPRPGGLTVLLQSKWDKPLARIRYNFERRFPHVHENPESLHVPGKGRHSSAPPPGAHACLGSV
jgi:hypothetical protein